MTQQLACHSIEFYPPKGNLSNLRLRRVRKGGSDRTILLFLRIKNSILWFGLEAVLLDLVTDHPFRQTQQLSGSTLIAACFLKRGVDHPFL